MPHRKAGVHICLHDPIGHMHRIIFVHLHVFEQSHNAEMGKNRRSRKLTGGKSDCAYTDDPGPREDPNGRKLTLDPALGVSIGFNDENQPLHVLCCPPQLSLVILGLHSLKSRGF